MDENCPVPRSDTKKALFGSGNIKAHAVYEAGGGGVGVKETKKKNKNGSKIQQFFIHSIHITLTIYSTCRIYARTHELRNESREVQATSRLGTFSPPRI